MSDSPACDALPYSNARIFLHWLSAFVILWASITGFCAACFHSGSLFRRVLDILNPQITALLIPFFIWRTVLYLKAAPWAEWPGLNKQELLASLVHALLYMLVIITLTTGVLMMPSPWSLLGVMPIPVLGFWHNSLFLFHKITCIALAGAISLHLAGVVFHLCRGHNILRKMRPHLTMSSNL